MRVLALDPGSVCTGFAVLETDGRHLRYVDSGVLRFDAKAQFLERIKFIYEESVRLFNQYQPNEVALEALIYVKSPTALMKLAQARGAMLAALTQTDCPVYEYAPTAVKAAVSGHGRTDKAGIEKILQLHLGSVVEFATHDESDAVAIGVCHFLHKSSIIPHRSRSVVQRKARSLGQALIHKIKDQSL